MHQESLREGQLAAVLKTEYRDARAAGLAGRCRRAERGGRRPAQRIKAITCVSGEQVGTLLLHWGPPGQTSQPPSLCLSSGSLIIFHRAISRETGANPISSVSAVLSGVRRACWAELDCAISLRCAVHPARPLSRWPPHCQSSLY